MRATHPNVMYLIRHLGVLITILRLPHLSFLLSYHSIYILYTVLSLLQLHIHDFTAYVKGASCHQDYLMLNLMRYILCRIVHHQHAVARKKTTLLQ